jgi:LDH2 family malate/lactate/ureidoglycolate dehydrogenase
MKVGVPADEAEIIVGLLARSDLRGVETHGVTRLPIYILRLQKGYMRKECQLEPLKDKPRQRSWKLMDTWDTLSRTGQWKRQSPRPRNTGLAGFR